MAAFKKSLRDDFGFSTPKKSIFSFARDTGKKTWFLNVDKYTALLKKQLPKTGSQAVRIPDRMESILYEWFNVKPKKSMAKLHKSTSQENLFLPNEISNSIYSTY